MKSKIYLLLILLFFPLNIIKGENPEDVVAKVASKLKKGGVSCDFTVKAKSGEVKGKIEGKGGCFMLQVPEAITWYDGKTMWTSNHGSKETTVYIPSATEIAQANPLTLINGYEKNYNVFFSRNKAPQGRKLILLNPKKKGTGIKAVQVRVNSSTSLPEEFVIRTEDDNIVTLTVRNLRTGIDIPGNHFSYPADKYRSYEMIDLR